MEFVMRDPTVPLSERQEILFVSAEAWLGRQFCNASLRYLKGADMIIQNAQLLNFEDTPRNVAN
jgi:hypothetical protein